MFFVFFMKRHNVYLVILQSEKFTEKLMLTSQNLYRKFKYKACYTHLDYKCIGSIISLCIIIFLAFCLNNWSKNNDTFTNKT